MNDLSRQSHGQGNGLTAAMTAAVARVIERGCFVLGPEVRGFEAEFAAWIGGEQCIGVGNGTDALQLALAALGIGPGDEVLCCANAGFYAAAAIVAQGAKPVFVDVEKDRPTMDPVSLVQRKSQRTKAVIVTHLYGRLADMAGLERAAGGVPIIEDCAHAHGAERNGKKAGSFGALAAFSFFPTKNLGALGDGGAVVTDDAALAQRVRCLAQYGWSGKYQAALPGGRNSRLDEIQAAVLRIKLPFLEEWITRRRWIANRYRMVLPPNAMPLAAGDDAVHLAVARLAGRDRLRCHLAAREIDSAIHYPVCDADQPALAAMAPFPALPQTRSWQDAIVSLPCFPGLTDDEVGQVEQALRSFTENERGD